eukprot:s1293_g9.t15
MASMSCDQAVQLCFLWRLAQQLAATLDEAAGSWGQKAEGLCKEVEALRKQARKRDRWEKDCYPYIHDMQDDLFDAEETIQFLLQALRLENLHCCRKPRCAKLRWEKEQLENQRQKMVEDQGKLQKEVTHLKKMLRSTKRFAKKGMEEALSSLWKAREETEGLRNEVEALRKQKKRPPSRGFSKGFDKICDLEDQLEFAEDAVELLLEALHVGSVDDFFGHEFCAIWEDICPFVGQENFLSSCEKPRLSTGCLSNKSTQFPPHPFDEKDTFAFEDFQGRSQPLSMFSPHGQLILDFSEVRNVLKLRAARNFGEKAFTAHFVKRTQLDHLDRESRFHEWKTSLLCLASQSAAFRCETDRVMRVVDWAISDNLAILVELSWAARSWCSCKAPSKVPEFKCRKS